MNDKLFEVNDRPKKTDSSIFKENQKFKLSYTFLPFKNISTQMIHQKKK